MNPKTGKIKYFKNAEDAIEQGYTIPLKESLEQGHVSSQKANPIHYRIKHVRRSKYMPHVGSKELAKRNKV